MMEEALRTQSREVASGKKEYAELFEKFKQVAAHSLSQQRLNEKLCAENTELKDKIKSLKTHRRRSELDIKHLEKSLLLVEHREKELREALTDQKFVNRQLKDEAEQQKSSMMAVSIHESIVAESHHEFSNEIAKAEKKHKKLLADWQQKYNSVELEIENLKRTMATEFVSRTVHEDLAEKFRDETIGSADMVVEIERLRRDKNKLDDAVSKLEELNLGLEVKCVNLETNNTTMRTELESVKSMLMQEKLDRVALEHMRRQCDELKARCTELEAAKDETERFSHSRTSQLDAQRIEAESRLQAKLSQLEVQKIEAENRLQSKYSQLEAQKVDSESRLMSRCAELESQKAELESRLQVKYAQLESMKAETETKLQTRFQELQSEKSSADTRHHGQRRAIESEAVRLGAENAILATRVGTLEAELEKVTAETGLLRRDLMAKMRELGAMQAQMDEFCQVVMEEVRMPDPPPLQPQAHAQAAATASFLPPPFSASATPSATPPSSSLSSSSKGLLARVQYAAGRGRGVATEGLSIATPSMHSSDWSQRVRQHRNVQELPLGGGKDDEEDEEEEGGRDAYQEGYTERDVKQRGGQGGGRGSPVFAHAQAHVRSQNVHTPTAQSLLTSYGHLHSRSRSPSQSTSRSPLVLGPSSSSSSSSQSPSPHHQSLHSTTLYTRSGNALSPLQRPSSPDEY